MDESEVLANEIQQIFDVMINNPSNSEVCVVRLNEIKQDPNSSLYSFCILFSRHYQMFHMVTQIKDLIVNRKVAVDDSVKNFVMQTLLTQFEQVVNDERIVKTLITIMVTINKSMDGQWEELNQLIINLHEHTDIFIAFVSEMVFSRFYNFILTNQEIIIPISLIGLNSNKWETKLKSISIVGFLVGVVLDPSIIAEHINIIIQNLMQSTTLNEDDFMKLWNEFKNIAELLVIEDEQKISIAQIAFEAASSFQGSALAMSAPIFAIQPYFGSLGAETIVSILDLLFNIAVNQLTDEQTLPDVLDPFSTASDFYPSDEYYQFIKGKMESADLNDESQFGIFIVAFCILNSVFDKLESRFKSDFDFYVTIFQHSAQSENTLLLTCVCDMINKFSPAFESILVNNNLFLDITIPCIISEDKTLQHSAINAVFNALDSVHRPVYGTFQKLWVLNSEIPPEILSQYMRLLGKSIEAEKRVDSELLTDLIPTLENWLQNEDTAVVSGAIAISMILVSFDEFTHESLLPLLSQATLSAICNTEDDDLMKSGYNCIAVLAKTLKSNFVQFFEPVIPMIQEISMNEESDRFARSQAAQALCEVALYTGSQDLQNQCVALLENTTNLDYIFFNILPTCSNFLSTEHLAHFIGQACQLIRCSASEDLVDDGVICLFRVLQKYKGESLQEIISICANFVFEYIRGNWTIQAGKSPADDLDVDSFTTICQLMAELFRTPFENNLNLLEFLVNLMSNEEVVDSIVGVFASAVQFCGPIPQFNEAFVNVALQLFVENLDIEMIQNESFFLKNLLTSSAVSIEFFADKMHIVEHWMTRCAPANENDLDALTSVVQLIWVISSTNSINCINLLNQTFQFFPPSDVEDLPEFIDILVALISNEAIIQSSRPYIAGSVARLLAMPAIQLFSVGLTPEQISAVVEVSKANIGFELLSSEIEKLNNPIGSQRALSLLQ